MEKNRSKVLMSILIVALCLSVCIGLTYAYFTDTASSKGNKIQAGSLKLDLQLYDQIGGWHSIKDSQDPVFNYDKWEPGYVDAKLLRVVNLGNLALKWEAKLVSTEAVSQYANVIEVYVQTSNSEMPYPASRAEALAWTHVGSLDDFINTTQQIANGIFTAQGESAYISIALYMPAEIEDNNLQGQVLGEFDIQINATQYTHEEDAIGSDYDTSARFPEGGVTPPDDTEDTTEPTETEPEPTETEPGDTDEPVEPTDPSMFTWAPSADGNSYTVTGLRDDVTPPADLVIPSTYNGLPVTAIGNTAFWGDADALDSICSVTIPNSITTIGNYAFRNSMISEITIPASVTTIGYNPFVNCSRLSNIIVDENNTDFQSIGGSLYSKDGTALLAYAPCGSLTPSESLANVSIIGNSAFEDCQDVYDVTIPSNVTTIGEDAFSGCNFLTNLVIENGVTTIGDFAFYGCHNLMGCDIPSSVTTIGKGAFAYCPGSFNVDANNAAYKSINGSLYSKDGTVLVAYAYGAYNEDFTIPNNVTTIEDYAFYFSDHLRKIIIPDSVTTIGEQTFYYCSDLTEIIFNGTTAQWNAISFGLAWNVGVSATEVVCTDGTVALN